MQESYFIVGYFLLGSVAGVFAGLLGVGGGLIIVPVLIFLFTLQGFDHSVIAHAAIGSALATMMATSVSSAREHHLHGGVNWPVFFKFAPGLLFGALAGAWLAGQMDTLMLKKVLGVFVILVSIQLVAGKQPLSERVLPSMSALSLTGSIIGTISGLVGIGGGSMTVPYLTWHGVSIRKAVATSSACGLPIALAGFAGFVLTGWQNNLMPSMSTGYIYWPAVMALSIMSVLTAPLGARLAHRLPVLMLKKIFAALLVIIGIRLLMT